MTRSIRRLVGVGIAALALGCFVALAVAPQVVATASSHQTRSTLSAGTLAAGIEWHPGAVLSLKASAKVVALKRTAAVTPTPPCTAARQALDAARTKDKAEDTSERTNAVSDPNFKTTDAAEDKAETAALKPLITAVGSACGFTKPAPSTQCASALETIKAAFAKDGIEDAAEKAAGTEGSAADLTEDKSETAGLVATWASIRTACGFTGAGGGRKWPFVSNTGWHH